MLQEGHALKAHGRDVAIGFVETHGRPHTEEQIGDLEIVPACEVPYKGVVLREMDTAAVVARHPEVALVDELAQTNAPGSEHEKRYQDIDDLLDAGIDVISTMNVQHLESLNDLVEQMTGVRVRETVPDRVLDMADQVELIDMAPQALIRRMVHGNIYPPAQARRALEHFFTVVNLSALRDLALRATAKEVEDMIATSMLDSRTATAGEKVMVAVDHRPVGKSLIREGRRMAAALRGELIVVYVEPVDGRRQAHSLEDERQLRANLQLADELGARVVRLRGAVSAELIAVAQSNRVSHVVIGHSTHGRLHEFLHGSVTFDLLSKMPEIDVHIVPAPGKARAR
jgi:two-component system sensor histidine kinase KdpD